MRGPHIRICGDDFASYDEAQSEGDYRRGIFRSPPHCLDFLPGEKRRAIVIKFRRACNSTSVGLLCRMG